MNIDIILGIMPVYILYSSILQRVITIIGGRLRFRYY